MDSSNAALDSNGERTDSTKWGSGQHSGTIYSSTHGKQGWAQHSSKVGQWTAISGTVDSNKWGNGQQQWGNGQQQGGGSGQHPWAMDGTSGVMDSSKVRQQGRADLLHAALPVAVLIRGWGGGSAGRGARGARAPGRAREAPGGAGLPGCRDATLVCSRRLPMQNQYC